MELNIRRTRLHTSWDAIANLPRAKMIAVLVAIVVPGGVLVPLCYAGYSVIRRFRG